VSAVLAVLNTSAVATTIKPSGTDTVNGALSLTVAAGASVYLTSDGVTKWLALAGGLADGDHGDIIVTGGGAGATSLTIDSAYTRARLEDMKAIASLHP
jgi:hypothetical protein